MGKTDTTQTPAEQTSRIGTLLEQPWARALAALVLVLTIGVVFNAEGTFFKWSVHSGMLREVSVYAILACGMTCVIITAGIDLSVGSVLGFTAVLFAILSIRMQLPFFIAIPGCLLGGTLCGLVSSCLISFFGMQPFIATLAMMVFARGLAKWISGGEKVSTYVKQPGGGFKVLEQPQVFKLINENIPGTKVAVVTIIALVCIVMTWILLSKLRWGRYIYAIGGNEEASRLSGIPVTRTRMIAYGISGFFSAVAGLCQAAQESQGDPETGATYELQAIAIVVIGGTSLMGGTGGIGLTCIGAMTIGYLGKILSINAVGEANRLMLTGLIIALAVLFQKRRRY